MVSVCSFFKVFFLPLRNVKVGDAALSRADTVVTRWSTGTVKILVWFKIIYMYRYLYAEPFFLGGGRARVDVFSEIFLSITEVNGSVLI